MWGQAILGSQGPAMSATAVRHLCECGQPARWGYDDEPRCCDDCKDDYEVVLMEHGLPLLDERRLVCPACGSELARGIDALYCDDCGCMEAGL